MPPYCPLALQGKDLPLCKHTLAAQRWGFTSLLTCTYHEVTDKKICLLSSPGACSVLAFRGSNWHMPEQGSEWSVEAFSVTLGYFSCIVLLGSHPIVLVAGMEMLLKQLGGLMEWESPRDNGIVYEMCMGEYSKENNSNIWSRWLWKRQKL